MDRQVDAIYENGVLRPLEPLNLEEKQRVRITVSNGDNKEPLADLLDTEFMERCARESSEAPGIETVRQMLSKIKGSMADVIISERNERF